MLVNLSIRNFGPVGDEPFEFSMETQQRTEKANKDKPYVVKIDSTECPYIMTSAGIFGPNASGKTTVLYALQTIEQVLEKSHRFDKDDRLPDESFKFSELKDACSEFDIVFLQGGYIYNYVLHYKPNKIEQEILNRKQIGKGKQWVEFINRKTKYVHSDVINDVWGKSLFKKFGQNPILDLVLWKSLNDNQSIIAELHNKDDVSIFDDIYNFFANIQMIRGGRIPTSMGAVHLEEYENEILDMLHVADFGTQDILFVLEKEIPNNELPKGLKKIVPELQKELKNKKKKTISIPSLDGRIYKIYPNKVEECSVRFKMQADVNQQVHSFELQDLSSGTKSFFAYAGILLVKLKRGGVICIDEIERSLHPYLTKHIVDMFNDPKINTGKAQLIFTSHDISLLSKKTLHPEQVYFTQKDDYTLQSELYSLAEFALKNDRDGDYGKKYLQGVFGAIPNIVSLW